MSISPSRADILNSITCCECYVEFALFDAHLAGLRKSHKVFYCPNGHQQCFPKKTYEELKIASLKEEIKILKTLKRTKQCPHCLLEFVRLDRHIKRVHKDCL